MKRRDGAPIGSHSLDVDPAVWNVNCNKFWPNQEPQ